jgi:alginate O-acetyltransferase complex protein AlgI
VLFDSHVFLFAFLPVVLAGWWSLRRDEHRRAFLVAASFVFYAWWDVRYVPLLAAVVGITHVAARRGATTAGIVANAAALAAFKYVGFAVDAFGFGELSIVLPLGVGFYTLNAISYLVDVRRGIVAPAPSLVQFAAYLTMFPHQIAGPIVRYADVGVQLDRPARRLTAALAAPGLTLIAVGLIKKLLIADTLAPTVDDYFGSPDRLTVTSAWAAAVGYTMQLYFDFSAYSDMAMGLALLLGIRFPANFRAPFQARNIAEFWRRWHITLSSWIRDYLYLPLGGSRGSKARTAANLTVVMVLAGLWHGADWTFLLWGLYNGVLLAGHAILRGRGRLPSSALLGRAATTLAFVLGMVLFRATSVDAAATHYEALAGLNGITGGVDVTAPFALFLAALLVAVNIAPESWQVALRPRLRPALAVACGALAAIAVLRLADPAPFLYFQF